jgi:hypothetical protein
LPTAGISWSGEDPLPSVEVDLLPVLTHRQLLVGCMLGAFVLTFLATRAITKAIREGRGPFRNESLGGVHIHHEVYGIFLLLGTGTAVFAYRPDGPWIDVLAALFGAGAALTLDEFALWLHLDDVYWAKEGRSSVDAVFIGGVIGTLLLVGASPFDDAAGEGAEAVAVNVTVGLICAAVAVLKGRPVLAVIGVFLPVVALVAALRLARPSSVWARRRYDPRKTARARHRFPPGHRTRWDRLVDFFAVAQPAATSAPATQRVSEQPPPALGPGP